MATSPSQRATTVIRSIRSPTFRRIGRAGRSYRPGSPAACAPGTLPAKMPPMSDKRDLYEIGQVPPVGHVPREMYAQVIRPERFGPPTQAFQVERVPVPELAPDDVLVCVMAAGINYNNV